MKSFLSNKSYTPEISYIHQSEKNTYFKVSERRYAKIFIQVMPVGNVFVE